MLEGGLLGALGGGMKGTAVGITAAVVFGLIAALFGKSGDKS